MPGYGPRAEIQARGPRVKILAQLLADLADEAQDYGERTYLGGSRAPRELATALDGAHAHMILARRRLRQALQLAQAEHATARDDARTRAREKNSARAQLLRSLGRPPQEVQQT